MNGVNILVERFNQIRTRRQQRVVTLPRKGKKRRNQGIDLVKDWRET